MTATGAPETPRWRWPITSPIMFSGKASSAAMPPNASSARAKDQAKSSTTPSIPAISGRRIRRARAARSRSWLPEKWCIKKKISKDWSEQRIKLLDLKNIMKSFSGNNSNGPENLFYYPEKGGVGSFSRRFKEEILKRKGKVKFKTNNAGGIVGGISNGDDVVVRLAVKPASSISKKQETITKKGKKVKVSVKGRHDPCLCPRAVPVAEAMMEIVLMDLYLIAKTRN